MSRVVSIGAAVIVLLLGLVCTGGASLAGVSGIGVDDSLSQQVSVRGGSVRSGRMILGGGLHGGK